MDIQRSSEGAGTRTLVVGGAALACILVIGFAIRFSSPRLLGNKSYLEKPPRSDVHTTATKIGSAVPAPNDVISGAVKHDQEGQENAAG